MRALCTLRTSHSVFYPLNFIEINELCFGCNSIFVVAIQLPFDIFSLTINSFHSRFFVESLIESIAAMVANHTPITHMHIAQAISSRCFVVKRRKIITQNMSESLLKLIDSQ